VFIPRNRGGISTKTHRVEGLPLGINLVSGGSRVGFWCGRQGQGAGTPKAFGLVGMFRTIRFLENSRGGVRGGRNPLSRDVGCRSCAVW
jgi:hypothetical protein